MPKRLPVAQMTCAALMTILLFTFSAQAFSTGDSQYFPLILSQQPRFTPTPAPPPTDWPGYLNYLRAQGDLPAIAINSDWSSGCSLHSRYMVKNDVIQHDEDPGNPWYTAAGDDAAGSSNLAISTSTSFTDIQAFNLWMVGPFHGLGLLDPSLLVTGFGSYREELGAYRTGACLDVLRGLGSVPASVTFPVRWPKPGGTMLYTRYGGNENPNPLTSCPGYTAPSGPPVYLQLGSGSITPRVTGHSFSQGSTWLEHCVFDETNYYNPNSAAQSVGRSVLNSGDAVILMPRAPLSPGLEYTVSITANGSLYTWSFTVSASAAKDSEIHLGADPGMPTRLPDSLLIDPDG